MRANRPEISRLERENFEARDLGVNGFRISGFEASDFKIESFRIEGARKPSLVDCTGDFRLAWVLFGVGFMVAPLGKIG